MRTAMEIADREGLDALTIRRLASELGVTPMALYWHFEDKQALLDALSDQLWIDARDLSLSTLTDEDVDGWIQVRHLITVIVDVFRQHPTLAMWAPYRVTECEAGLTITELTLGLLEKLGLDTARACDIAQFLLGAALMLVGTEPGVAYPDEALRNEMMRHKQARLLSLPPERYPHIVAATPFLVSCDANQQHYDLGIDLIMGGMRVAAGTSIA